jgi:hypothetical protein
MTHRFNLSVEDYNINELKALLNLNDPYTLEDIVENENELREKLLMDVGVSEEKKREIISFLQKAKNTLIQKSKKQFSDIEEITEGENPIIKKKQTDIVNKVNTVPRSKIINASENVNTIKKLLSINSLFREDYFSTKSTNYIYTLPEVLKNVVSMELGSIEIPMTYYQIQRLLGNNHFWFEWADPSYNTTTTATPPPTKRELNEYYIEIPDGNYTSSEMQVEINKQMVHAINGHDNINPITEEYDISNRHYPQCYLDTKTQKLGFFIRQVVASSVTVLAGADNKILNIYFDKEKRGTPCTYMGPLKAEMIELKNDFGIIGAIGWILGFRNSYYELNKTVAISEGCYDGWGNKYLFLVINDYNKNINNFCITSYNKSVARSNILARIPTKGLCNFDFKTGLIIQNNSINNNDSFKKREYFGPVDINRIEIQLIDEYNRIIDLNYMDISFSLNITCLYDL